MLFDHHFCAHNIISMFFKRNRDKIKKLRKQNNLHPGVFVSQTCSQPLFDIRLNCFFYGVEGFENCE